MYLEADIGLGAGSPAYGTIVAGIQQLNPSVMDDMMTLLSKRVLVQDPQGSPANGVFNFLAVTLTRLAEMGLQPTEATKNAADYIKALPAGQYALVSADDVNTYEQAPKGSDFATDVHVTVAVADAVPLMAASGQSLVVLWPLTGTTGETPKKSMAAPLIGMAIGAGGGALVGGGIGAIVGGVAGYLVGNAVA